MKKNFFAAALTLGVATLASGLLSAPAKAQVTTGVNIEVNIPDVVFLETFDTITFNPQLSDLTGGASTDGKFSPGKTNVTGDIASPTLSTNLGDGTTSPSITGDNKTYTGVPVYKVWGLGGSGGNIRHTVSYNDADLIKGSNGSVIDVVSITGNTSTGLTATAPGLNYNNAIEQKLDFTFNFGGVKESGVHTGGVLTITATAE